MHDTDDTDDTESAGPEAASAHGYDQHNETLVRSAVSTRSGLRRSTKAVVAGAVAGAGVLAWSSPALAYGSMQHNETLVRSPARRR